MTKQSGANSFEIAASVLPSRLREWQLCKRPPRNDVLGRNILLVRWYKVRGVGRVPLVFIDLFY